MYRLMAGFISVCDILLQVMCIRVMQLRDIFVF